MKTRTEFKSYVVIWIIAVLVFNVLAFIFKQSIIGNRLMDSFVTFNDGASGTKQVFRPEFLNLLFSYVFVMLAFIGQLICTKIFLSQETLKKTLYNYPIFKISLQGLFLTIIFAVIFCFTNLYPVVSFVIFIITLLITVVRCITSKTAANMVSAKDENIELKTQYIKVLKGEADSLYSRVKDSKEKNEFKKVLDAVKYSDPVSIPDLVLIEKDLIDKFSNIKSRVNAEKFEEFKSACVDFLNVLADRNAKIKSLKK